MGTKTENEGLSDTKIVENDEFSAISTALAEGNVEELDRLMAAKEADADAAKQAKEQEDNSQDDSGTTPSDDSTKGKDNEDDQDDGAAGKAASTDGNQKDEANELELLKQELHRLKSDAGRVAHLQRTVQTLQQQIRAHEQTARTSQPSTTPQKNDKKEIPEHLRKRIDALKEIDPDLADTFDAFAKTMVDTAEERANEVRQTVEERHREQEDIQFWKEQKAELYRYVPRCDEIFQMPQWQEWKESLTSPGIRGLIESGYAQDMATAIQMFAYEMQKQGMTQRGASSEGGDPNANTNADAASSHSKEVAEARARKVGAAADVKSSAAKKETELDPQAQFQELYRKLAKENHVL